VAGIALTSLYSEKGAVGSVLSKAGIKVAFTPLGIITALIFVSIPFAVRTLQPVLRGLESEYEEAAESLGANKFQIFLYVILPSIAPALFTGFSLSFARAVGEYGSVIFIAGNIPMISEIAPLVIVTKLEQYDYEAATAIATLMLFISFLMLLSITIIQSFMTRHINH
jgi:sulfate transport system permease protein